MLLLLAYKNERFLKFSSLYWISVLEKFIWDELDVTLPNNNQWNNMNVCSLQATYFLH